MKEDHRCSSVFQHLSFTQPRRKMLEECDGLSAPPTQEGTSDVTTEHVTCDPPSFKVPDHLLDLMAADDKKKLLAATETLEVTRKLARAEAFLRKKFRYSR